MSNWVTLGEYLDKEVLVQTEAILNGNNIFFQVKTPENHLNSAFLQATSQPFIVLVRQDQYELAKQLIYTQDENALGVDVSFEEYSLAELKDIVFHPEDWHEEYVKKATNELHLRGTEVAASDIEETRKEKIKQLERGIEPSRTIYYFMWLFSIMGGYLGIIAGYFYWRGKVRGVDGKRYFMYTEKYRNQGYYMFLLGLISALLQTYLFMN